MPAELWLEIENARAEGSGARGTLKVMFKHDRSEASDRWFPVKDAAVPPTQALDMQNRLLDWKDKGRTALGRVGPAGENLVCDLIRFQGPDRPAR